MKGAPPPDESIPPEGQAFDDIKSPPAEIQNILKDVPEPQRRVLTRHLMQITQTHYSGPLPPPFIIEGYERVLPGSADRILKMAENQAEHRQSLETKVISSNILNEKLGLIFGLLLAVGFLTAGFLLVWDGKEVTGLVALGAPIIGIIGAYIDSQRRKQRELAAKREALSKDPGKTRSQSALSANASRAVPKNKPKRR